MNEHEQFRERLTLAASGALSAGEAARVEQHLACCRECAEEFAQWSALTQALRRLPTPQPSPMVVERARSSAVSSLHAARERRENVGIVIFLGVFAWSFTVAGWVISLLLTGGPAELAQLLAGHVPPWLAIFSALGWTAAGTAAVVLGARHRAQEKLA